MHAASNAAPYFILCFTLIDYTPFVTDGYDCVACGAAVQFSDKGKLAFSTD
jgi:hypothetical protein